METLFYTGFTIALFCLGVAAGAIIENRLIKMRNDVCSQTTEIIKEIKKIEPLLISLADQVERKYINSTPIMHEMQDPDRTMEIPAVKDATWLKEQNH